MGLSSRDAGITVLAMVLVTEKPGCRLDGFWVAALQEDPLVALPYPCAS